MKKITLQEVQAEMTQKASMKQSLYIQTLGYFNRMQEITRKLSSQLTESFKSSNPPIPVKFEVEGELEFRLRFSGDLLVFQMHSNIMALPEDHPVMRHPHLIEFPENAYFGQILIYNFMADSFRYLRMQDMGHLVARIWIHKDALYWVEGVRPLNFLQPGLSETPLNDESLEQIVLQCVYVSSQTDFMASPFYLIQQLTVEEKISRNENRAGDKLGFQMQSKGNDTKS
jgi:hypothetical protein